MLRRLAVLAPTAVLALALVLVPRSAGARSTKKVSPFDLKITGVVVKQLPGNPKYLLLNEISHTTQRFDITVTTHNYGAKVGPTKTYVKLELNGRRIIWHGIATVPTLRYRESVSHTWEVDIVHADPGLLEPVAIADATHKITERNESNNIKTAPIISVIPRDWNVSAFQTNVDLGNGLTGGTFTDNGFRFQFDHLDEARKEFIYTGWGTIRARTSFVATGCSGQGNDQATKTPWPGSDDVLTITANLSKYSAGITTMGQPQYGYVVTCPGPTTIPQMGSWVNLVTWKNTYSWIPMQFSATTLGDSGQANTPQGHATYSWTFNARLSGV